MENIRKKIQWMPESKYLTTNGLSNIEISDCCHGKCPYEDTVDTWIKLSNFEYGNKDLKSHRKHPNLNTMDT